MSEPWASALPGSARRGRQKQAGWGVVEGGEAQGGGPYRQGKRTGRGSRDQPRPQNVGRRLWLRALPLMGGFDRGHTCSPPAYLPSPEPGSRVSRPQ